MNTKCIVLFVGAFGTMTAALNAGPRSSANYNILTDALDYGGVTAKQCELPKHWQRWVDQRHCQHRVRQRSEQERLRRPARL